MEEEQIDCEREQSYLSVETWGKKGAMRGERSLSLRQHVGGQAAGQLHLMLNRAVLVEVPEEAILVVGNLHSHSEVLRHHRCINSRASLYHQQNFEVKSTSAQFSASCQDGRNGSYRGNEGQDEAAASAHFTVASPVLHVFPQHAVILLVHAHCLLDQHRLSFIGVEHGVKVVDLQWGNQWSSTNIMNNQTLLLENYKLYMTGRKISIKFFRA